MLHYKLMTHFNIIYTTLIVFFITLIILFKITNNIILSYFISFIKSFLYLFYYIFWLNKKFVAAGDNLKYLKYGKYLYNRNIDLLNFFLHYQYIFQLANGRDIIYYPYIAESFRIFGIGLYAPIAMNIILTDISALFFYKIIKDYIGFSMGNARILTVYFLVEPFVFTYSTFFDGKGILVMCLLLICLYGIGKLTIEKNYFIAIVSLFISNISLLFLRFYYPFLILLAFIIANLIFKFINKQLFKIRNLLYFLILFLLIPIYFLKVYTFKASFTIIEHYFINPLYGILHFVLSPMPFHSSSNYAFFNIPAMIYYLLLPLLLAGFWKSLKVKEQYMLIINMFFIILVVFYGSFALLNGPRYRIPLVPIIIIYQFYGFLIFFKNSFAKGNLSKNKFELLWQKEIKKRKYI